ncbi:hypothetical protein [Acinetobacter tianfuensis]|uniref:Uncharacterized protein n=1 Tax=Acinetobacter tianfuensis TaxID=2419603 RepID=A0A3A8EK34_9GAMM|nr:hypothetical protein [Acinetobacter tianfuensis]RKG34508.1 hypothetical protein D7V32_00030 [Acinetobacter tianfuensis]
MTRLTKASQFRQRCLAAAVSMLIAPSVFALQDLSDETLSETTGEGVALLPENFKMVFQGPNDFSAASSYNKAGAANPEKYDTGFIRIIPVGEDYSKYASVNSADLAKQRTKADIFIYGLALSKSDNDLNKRFSNTGFSWGTSANPWLFRAGTASNIQQFQSANTAGDLGYLALEAPLATVAASDLDNNIKLGFWADAFSRSLGSSNKVDAITGAPVLTDAVNDLLKEQRLRLQVVANGLSINGSQVRFFQTQQSTVPQQNQTLGMATIIRMNTNDDPSALVYENTAANKALLDAKGLRISTQAIDDGTAVTPAIDRSFAPLFDPSEGLYLYSPNINLVLGNIYQPFVVGSEGKNIILEVTRIPNVPSIYKQIYTYYADTDGANTALTAAQKTEYKGSTCNVSVCGTPITLGSGASAVAYQGNNATHSSIAIGSVSRDAATNLLKANTAANSTGVVFRGSGTAVPVNLGSAVIDGVLIQHLKIKTTGL